MDQDVAHHHLRNSYRQSDQGRSPNSSDQQTRSDIGADPHILSRPLDRPAQTVKAGARRPSPSWWPRARSCTSGCSRPGPRRSAELTPCTRSLRCRRVLAVDPRSRGRAAPPAARAGHRVRALLAARARLPHRDDPLPGGPRRRRLAQEQPALHRGQLREEPPHRRRGRGRRLRSRRYTGTGRLGLATRAG